MFMGFEFKELRYTDHKIPKHMMIHGTTLRFAEYSIQDFRTVFENILRINLEYGDYNADESVFSLMTVRYPYLIGVVGKIPWDAMKEINLSPSFYAQTFPTVRSFIFSPSHEAKGWIDKAWESKSQRVPLTEQKLIEDMDEHLKEQAVLKETNGHTS